MKNPTKVQETIPLSEVPSWTLKLIDERALRALSSACEELKHLASQQLGSTNPSPDSIVHHVLAARQKMYEADLLLQDAHAVIAGYINHVEEVSTQELEEKIEKTSEELERGKEYLEELGKMTNKHSDEQKTKTSK